MNDSRLSSLSISSVASPGQSLPVTIRLQNIGTTTWTPADYKLAINGPDWPVWGEPTRQSLNTNIAPGQTATFTFNVTAPQQARSYMLNWKMIYGSIIEWFGASAVAAVLVQADPPKPDIGQLILPAPRPDPLDLIGAQIFNTDALPMDGQPHEIIRTWNGSRTFRITELDIWIGALYDNIADMGVSIWRIRIDGSQDLMQAVGWDHYVNPAGPVDISTDFGQYYFSLLKGESLKLRYVFTPLGDASKVRQGQATVNLRGVYV